MMGDAPLRGAPRHVSFQGMIQSLSNEAEFLQGKKDLRPRPTLAAQRDKIQEVEKLAMLRAGGTVVPVPGNASHKRATEQARASVLARGVVEIAPAESCTLNPAGNLDTELYRSHAERLTNWLEQAKHTTTGRAQRIFRRSLVRDHRASNAALVESCGVKRALVPAAASAAAADAAATASTHPSAAGGCAAPSSGDLASPLPLDARAPQYCEVVRDLSSVVDPQSAAAQAQHLAQLAGQGAHGQRPDHHKRSVEGLWQTVGKLMAASCTPCEASLRAELARVDACRSLLEEDFSLHLRREYGEGLPAVGTLELAEQYAYTFAAPTQPGAAAGAAVGAGDEVSAWAVAFLCLRTGDVSALGAALARIGDAEAAAAASKAWPPVRRTRSGPLALNLAAQGAKAFRSFTDAELAANPFRAAVRLVLSRSATVRDAERVQAALAGAAALKFAQDHVWLNLCLVNCVEASEPCTLQDRLDAPCSLAHYVSTVQAVHPSELMPPLDPLLYVKVMLWSQCPAQAVAALLPPTCIADLADFSLEGLHLALILNRHGFLADSPSVQGQLQAQVERYVTRLVPHRPSAGLQYLRLLPEAAMQQAFYAVSMESEVSRLLLGRAAANGTVDSDHSAAADFWPPAQCASLARGAAAAARERGLVLLSADQSLIAVHHSLAAQPQGATQGAAAGSVRELLGFLNPRLAHVILELDETTNLSQATQDVLSASRLVYAHSAALTTGASSGEALALQAFHQLYWIAVLSWNVLSQDVLKGWQAFSTLGVLPRTLADVPRLVEEINFRADAGTVRKVIHVGVVRAFDLICHGLSTLSDSSADDRVRLIGMARALNTFQSQLRVPPASIVAQRLAQRSQMLLRLGV
eukprot:Rhum_TRINITY_DN8877_c0_g1::Rhum_TRINITY_DN8877_c0_g1_i1::g.30416::m.30416/K14309/NUP93, NIC96; nuclear pore complex protein Nup93